MARGLLYDFNKRRWLMVDSIQSPVVNVSVESPRVRQTPDNSFSAVMGRGADQALQVASAGSRVAASVLPGGAIINAVADGIAGVTNGGGISTDKWALLRAQEQMQDEGMANSLRLLEVQRKMQEDTEAVNLISNLMKSQHEMNKATINNFRS
jgi:hypothetical protein